MKRFLFRERRRIIAHLVQLQDEQSGVDLFNAAQKFCRIEGIPATDRDLQELILHANETRIRRKLRSLQRQINLHHPQPDP